MSSSLIVVERRDTREIVGSLPMPTVHRFVEEQRAACFAAWRFGATCWARAGVNGRVLHVGRPDHYYGFPAPLRVGDRIFCPWPGCASNTWVEGVLTPFNGKPETRLEWMRRHAREEHVLCGCGRFFNLEGWRKHRGQVRRTDRRNTHTGAILAIRLRPRATSNVAKP